jgi:Fic family protein
MLSLSADYLEKLKFTDADISTLKKIGEYKGKQALFFQQTPEILKTLKNLAIIESSESSNRLEGITAPHHRIEEITLKSTAPTNRSEQEIAGYRDVLNLIHESGEHIKFTVNMILQCHSMLYRYLSEDGGRWKMVDNEIVERHPDGTIKRVRFKPANAVATPHMMEQLALFYTHAIEVGKEPLIALPLAILDFLCIHPFKDGNGRMSRLLTLMLLYHFDYQVGRFISLERIFEESKETYYETLYSCSQGWHKNKHDVMPWLRYFWGVLLKAYKEFEERVGDIRTSKGAKTQQIIDLVNRKFAPFAISDLERELPGISRDMIRRVLRQLRDQGKVRTEGKGRNVKWVLN